MSEDLAVTSHEQDGRILSGVGATADDLSEVMDRHTPEEAPDQPVPASAKQEPAQTRGQKRFSELTREREDQKRRADAAEKERDELRSRISQSTGSQAPAPPETRGAAPSEPNGAENSAISSTRPEPSEDEIGAKYKSYAEFAKDLSKWVVEQEQTKYDARIRAGIEADRASRSFSEQIAKVQAKGREAYQDFDAIVTSGPGSHVPMTTDRLQAIVNHPASEHLQYVIAKDAALAQRLATCHPFEFGTELARLTPASSDASPASSATPALATAPAPYQPVGSGGKTSSSPSADLIKGFDFDKSGYREKRAAERAGRRR